MSTEWPCMNEAAMPFAKQNPQTDCKADWMALGKVGSPIISLGLQTDFQIVYLEAFERSQRK